MQSVVVQRPRGRGGGGATSLRKCPVVCVGYLKMDPF